LIIALAAPGLFVIHTVLAQIFIVTKPMCRANDMGAVSHSFAEFNEATPCVALCTLSARAALAVTTIDISEWGGAEQIAPLLPTPVVWVEAAWGETAMSPCPLAVAPVW